MLHVWKYLWGTSKNTNTWLWLEGISFGGHGFGFLLFQGKEIDRPKTTQKKTLRFWHWLAIFFGGGRIFTDFSQFWNGMQRFLLFVTLFSARSPEPSDSLEVEGGSLRREILFRGGVMSVWYRSILFECFKWFAWWKTDGGFWVAYPFW